MGRPPISKVAMTASERQARWRAKQRRRALLAGKRDKAALRAPRATSDVEQDLWSTPPCLIAALIHVVLPTLPPGPVWEPAAGAGALLDPLRAAGREVVASDIEPQRRDIARLDYLQARPPPRGAVMITNPPFSRLDAFLARTLALLDAGLLAGAALLVRDDFTGTDGRADALTRAIAEWECSWRARWIPGSTGNQEMVVSVGRLAGWLRGAARAHPAAPSRDCAAAPCRRPL